MLAQPPVSLVLCAGSMWEPTCSQPPFSLLSSLIRWVRITGRDYVRLHHVIYIVLPSRCVGTLFDLLSIRDAGGLII